jgi:penicillin-binding protein 2
MRIKFLVSIFVLFWVVLLIRIYYISIQSHTYYEQIAENNVIKVEQQPPLRGLILDRFGEPLAVNQLGFSVGIAPHLSAKSQKDRLEKEIDFIVGVLGEKYLKEDLLEVYKKYDSPYNHNPVNVIDFVSYNEMLPKFVQFSHRENITITQASKRFYPDGSLASHVIGYVSKANLEESEQNQVAKLTGFIGKNGIESYYNDALSGTSGFVKYKVTAKNKKIEELQRVAPKRDNITLTIDKELQRYTASLFQEDSGAVIIMNALDGSILTAGSFPEYDLNSFVSGISQKEWEALSSDFNHPFSNRLINGLYPPGSVVKMGVALSLLNSKLVNEYSKHFCESSYELGGRKFRCWKDKGHGWVDMKRAIRESCDDFFYKSSFRVGINTISSDLERYGLGQKTGIDLPREFYGVVPSRQWKKNKYGKPWYQGETLISSIGQGYFLVTPMQIARHTALLATGKLVTPRVVAKVGEVPTVSNSLDVFNDFEKNKLSFIQDAMYEVVHHDRGTARWYINTKVDVAGKTGTAQVVGIPQNEKKRMKEEELDYYSRSHAWLTTFAPFKEPKYVITVLVEHGGHGGNAAGGIVTKLYNKMRQLGYLK